jgi:hypothetical protein
MNPNLRWLLMLPAIAFSAVASWLIYPVGRIMAIAACPSGLRSVEATTDFSQHGYSFVSETCMATWFPGIEVTLLSSAVLLSVLISGLVGFRLSPSHQKLSAALSVLSVAGFVAVAFAYGT